MYGVGGPFMNVITLFGLLTLVITIWKAAELITKKKTERKYLDLILMGGVISLAIGMLAQIIGIVQALEAIRAATDVSPQMIMGGAIISFYAPIYGFVVFIFSLLFYFILKEVVRAVGK